MSKKPAKPTVELRPSRIRREPAPGSKPEGGAREVRWQSSEREIAFALIGIIAFAVAIDIIVVAVVAYWQ